MPWNSRSANVSANQQVKQLYLCKGNPGEYEERATLIHFTGLPPKFSSKLLHFPSTNPRFLLLSSDVHCNGTELKYIPAKHHLRPDTTLLGRLLGNSCADFTDLDSALHRENEGNEPRKTNQPTTQKKEQQVQLHGSEAETEQWNKSFISGLLNPSSRSEGSLHYLKYSNAQRTSDNMKNENCKQVLRSLPT